MIVVLMGVMGSGKTTIGKHLSERINVPFVDADDYHSAENKAKMKAGHPLDDSDRSPWLTKLNELMQQWISSGTSGVLACSALKEKYREILQTGIPKSMLCFVLLDTPKQLLVDRLAQRQHEFMNPDLLTTQLQTLEKPHGALIIINNRSPDEVTREILQRLPSSF